MPMAKIKKAYHLRLKPVRLYLDDVDELAATFKEIAGKVEITAPGYGFDEPADLRELGKTAINELKFVIRDPYVILDLTPTYASVYAEDDTVITRGIVSKLTEILNRRRLLLFRVDRNTKTWTVFVGLTTALFYSFILAAAKGSALFAVPLLVAFAASLAYTIMVARTTARKYNVVVLKSRSEGAGFWTKYRDYVVVAAAILILASLITPLVIKLTEQGKP
jgi:hypothetical protein